MLIAVRGVPGSGKSTWVKEKAYDLYGPFKHVETDMFFTKNGEYKFNKLLLQVAHQWCFGEVILQLSRGHTVIVSNTFVKLWEIERYLQLIDEYGGEVVHMHTLYSNVHGVPKEIVEKKLKEVEAIPSNYKVRNIF